MFGLISLGIIFPETLTKKSVKYNVIPIGIKTTIPAIKLFLIFENSDLILIERQPPQGLTNIQDVLAYQYIDKVKLIYPRSVHKHFCLSKTDYNIRKKQTEKIADKYLSDNKIYKYSDRKHDIADALCQVLYYVTINKVVDVYIPDDIDKFLKSCMYTNSSRTF